MTDTSSIIYAVTTPGRMTISSIVVNGDRLELDPPLSVEAGKPIELPQEVLDFYERTMGRAARHCIEGVFAEVRL